MAPGLYTTLVIIGPIVLALAILYALLRNKTSRAQDRRTEEATRELYKRESADDRNRTP